VGWWLRRRLGGRNALLLPLLTPLIAAILGMVPWPGVGALWAERQTSPYLITAVDDRPQEWALFTPLGHRWDATYAGSVLKPPMSDNPHTGRPFVLGTDTRGRDVAVRMLAGARISITIGALAAGIAFVIGTLIGAVSGYVGGLTDILLQRVVELVMTFPVLILLLLVAALVSRNVFFLVTVIGLTSWTGTARLVRGEFLAMADREYVLAARCLGYSRFRIMFRHILPNIMTPLLISLTFGVAGAVGLEAGLSFLGLGDPNAPSWGEILNQGRQNIQYAWLIYVPGLTIFAFICVLYAIGDQLREAFDPKG
jgi:peptide/nickel transport system permease protein